MATGTGDLAIALAARIPEAHVLGIDLSALSLTYAGEYVLSFAETMNRENANLMDILADIQKQKRGLILFGASTLRMSASLPDIPVSYTHLSPPGTWRNSWWMW